MNNQEHLSALVDGELEALDLLQLLEGVCDKQAKTFARYNLIGEVLRGRDVAPAHTLDVSRNIVSRLIPESSS